MMQQPTGDRHEPRRQDAAAEAELERWFAETAASAPGEAAWSQLLERIDREAGAALARQRLTAGRRSLRFARLLVPIAAAVVLAAVWFRSTPHETPPGPEVPAPYPVASADEVEIVSMEGADYHALVVGKPPLSEPIVLVAHGDATEIRVQPDVDGMVPAVAKLADGLATTMIVAPLLSSGDDGK